MVSVPDSIRSGPTGGDGEPPNLWPWYWLAVLATGFGGFAFVVLVALAGGDAGEFGASVLVLLFVLALSLPLVGLISRTPAGYPALSQLADRFRPSRAREADRWPPLGRTIAECLSVLAMVGTYVGVVIFQPPLRSRGFGLPLAQDGTLAEHVGLVSDPEPYFFLSVCAIVFNAIFWVLLWLTR